MTLGWTSDGQLYVASADTPAQASKSRSSTRTPVHALRGAPSPPRPSEASSPIRPIITPDGNTYGFDYRVRLSDLYTVTGVR